MKEFSKKDLKGFIKEEKDTIKALEISIRMMQFDIEACRKRSIDFETRLAAVDLGFGKNDRLEITERNRKTDDVVSTYEFIINSIGIVEEKKRYWLHGTKINKEKWCGENAIVVYEPNETTKDTYLEIVKKVA